MINVLIHLKFKAEQFKIIFPGSRNCTTYMHDNSAVVLSDSYLIKFNPPAIQSYRLLANFPHALPTGTDGAT